jgi:two-component system response regulator
MIPFKKKILIVDDDEDDYSLMSDAFQESCPDGVELDWKKDGEEALDYFFNREDNGLPVLVLLDLNMPKVDGREVLRQLRAAEKYQHLPVIVFTNSEDRRDILESYRMGANSYVRKPAGYGELVNFARAFCDYWFKYSSFID